MSPSALARQLSSMDVVAVYMWMAYPVFCSALQSPYNTVCTHVAKVGSDLGASPTNTTWAGWGF